jgi:hypothetical protein
VYIWLVGYLFVCLFVINSQAMGCRDRIKDHKGNCAQGTAGDCWDCSEYNRACVCSCYDQKAVNTKKDNGAWKAGSLRPKKSMSNIPIVRKHWWNSNRNQLEKARRVRMDATTGEPDWGQTTRDDDATNKVA